MQGSANPANNLWFAGAVVALYGGAVTIIKANHWMVIPDDFIGNTSTAIFALAAHFYDWKTGDNKPQ